jgi:hypothetical protein
MFGRQRGSTRPPKPSRLWQGVRLTPSVSPPLAQHAGLPQRLGRTLADRLGAADDPPIELALILGALHAFIMAFRLLFR